MIDSAIYPGNGPFSRKSAIRAERAYYSRISGDPLCLEYMLLFLMANPDVFSLLDEGAQEVIKNAATPSLNDFAKAKYLSATLADHIKQIDDRVQNGHHLTSKSAFRYLADAAESDQDSLLLLGTGVTLFPLANNPESA